ncbi:UNKNOWN [Stylonychia lemnae]|uniref:Uncharacterized protein n=1 Tax=Stylonychia lemnae TaxID=5949 RepID=A0A077ZZH2_STYLE|nr:UNKNOWN [Stylonychia lemnae]|eukprot:CDW74633.1 UNKNOWN [Stylonychia lemnae]
MIISDKDFDIGFEVNFIYMPEEDVKSIDQYIELPVSKCQAGRFKGEQSQTETFNITNKYSCPIDFKTAFQGSYATQYAQLLQVQVRKCNQTNLTKKDKSLICASAAEMDRILNYMTLNVLMTNQFIDVNEKVGNPIRTVLKQFFATSYTPSQMLFQMLEVLSEFSQSQFKYWFLKYKNTYTINLLLNNNFKSDKIQQSNSTKIKRQEKQTISTAELKNQQKDTKLNRLVGDLKN